MDLGVLVDRLLPPAGSRYDEVSAAGRDLAQAVLVDNETVRPLWKALHGNEWLSHPLHVVVITVPIGAWTASAWYDLRSAVTKHPGDEYAADAALRVGIVGAVAAALTGVAQYVDTRGSARREATAHAALNNVALVLYLGSWAARRRNHRKAGRRLAALGHLVVSVSGYLGSDLSYRHGVGVRPQALRDLDVEAQDTSDAPLQTAGAWHR